MTSLRSLRLALGLAVALACPSCLYQDVVLPLDEDLQVTELGDKRGEATARSYLGLVLVGDAGLQAAAENGEITVMRHADRRIFNVLFLYSSYTTIVYGD